jgi:hypothetical protein
MRLEKSVLFVALTSLSGIAMAGECVLKITRTACPGKEAEAFKPYDGKQTTEEKKVASSADACGKQAEKASQIVRKGTLSAKSVAATFDGAAVPATAAFQAKADCN